MIHIETLKFRSKTLKFLMRKRETKSIVSIKLFKLLIESNLIEFRKESHLGKKNIDGNRRLFPNRYHHYM